LDPIRFCCNFDVKLVKVKVRLVMEKIQWNRNRPKQAFKLALLGCTDREIADFMEVSEHTLTYWKRTKPGFARMLNKGKATADAKVAVALYRKAIGYSHVETKVSVVGGEVVLTDIIKHYPPDSWAAVKWLSIRQRSKWMEITKTESTHTNLNILKMDFSGITTEELMALKKVGLRNQLPQDILAKNVSSN